MTSGASLPAELSRLDDGHVTDIVVTALADGQEALVIAGARQHVAECEACSARLAEAALLSLRATELLGSSVPLERAARSRSRARALPARAIALALAVAAIGVIPLVADTLAALPATTAMVRRALPILARSAMVVVRHGSVGLDRATTLVTWLSAGVVLVLGLAVARAARRRATAEDASVQGGM